MPQSRVQLQPAVRLVPMQIKCDPEEHELNHRKGDRGITPEREMDKTVEKIHRTSPRAKSRPSRYKPKIHRVRPQFTNHSVQSTALETPACTWLAGCRSAVRSAAVRCG